MQKADVKVQIWSRQIHLRLLLQKKKNKIKLVSIHPPSFIQVTRSCGPLVSAPEHVWPHQKPDEGTGRIED